MAHQALDFVTEPIWHWRETQGRREELVTFWGRHEPSDPEIGEGWYDEESDCMYVWDGHEWVCAPND